MAITSYKNAGGECVWPDAVINEIKDYGINWSTRMADESDTIQTVNWTVPAGLTNVDTDLTDNVARIWLQADTVGDYIVKCKVETLDGLDSQTYIQNMHITVVP